MKSLVATASLTLIFSSAFCQNRNVSFDRKLSTLTNKPWLIKAHFNEDFKILDSDYYFFPPLFMEASYDERKNCVHLANYKYVRNNQTNRFELKQQTCNPIICFCDSTANNSYSIYANWNGGPFKKGNMTFLNDSQFSCTPFYGQSVIFNAVKPNKDLQAIIPTIK